MLRERTSKNRSRDGSPHRHLNLPPHHLGHGQTIREGLERAIPNHTNPQTASHQESKAMKDEQSFETSQGILTHFSWGLHCYVQHVEVQANAGKGTSYRRVG